jgi:hypothetical protein
MNTTIELLAKYDGAAGITVEVFSTSAGGFRVVVKDPEAGESVGVVEYRDEARAIAYARRCAEGR